MSGIAGFLRRDGAPAPIENLNRMIAAIAHRGPDDAGVWAEGSVGLGNCLLRTTPESIHEHLPRKASEAPFVIAADARIDNRADLMEALGVRGIATITDSELILNAYAKWGEKCPIHLIGDFSFAIWDARQQRLFCARDSAGTRSLYYFAAPGIFAFGSEIKAILALPEIPAELNEQRVGDFIINLFEDRTITFYKNILRLPAAHCLTVTRDRLDIRNYWKLDASREIRFRTDQEYTEAFRDIFGEAVKCRVRSSVPVGSALSGGLDSSAIACYARDLLVQKDSRARLHTFSVIFPEAPEQDLRSIDEREYVDSVLRTGNFEPHYVRGDRLSPLQDMARVHRHLDEPNFAPNLYLHWGMYAAAQQQGVRVFLDGLDGDTTVSHGFELLDDLAKRMRWIRLYREGSLLAKNLFQGSNARRILWRYCFRDMMPNWAHRAWRLAHGRFGELRGNSTLVSAEFEQRLNLRRRALELNNTPKPKRARDHHLKALQYSLYAHALEMADKASSAFGIEARYPFFDRRLIEFCLAAPPEQKLANGWNRVVFRRAMQGILPYEIQWRCGKGNLSSNFHRNLLEFEAGALDELTAPGGARISPYVDMAALRYACDSYKAAPLALGGKHSLELFIAANLEFWMRNTQLSRTVGETGAKMAAIPAAQAKFTVQTP